MNKKDLHVLCLVSYNFLPAKMGGQKGIASFYDFFSKEVNITCVATKGNDASAAAYPVLNILSNSQLRYINIFYFFTLRKIIKARNITHLQIEHPYYGWLALLVQKFCKVKLILHSHNIEGERFKSIGKWWWQLLLAYEGNIHRRCDYIFFVTEEDRQYSINKFKTGAGKCLTTPYGIEWQQAPTEEDRMQCRNILQSKCDIEAGDKVLFLNGSFSHKPNFDALIFVLDKLNPELLQRNGFQYKILICGKGIPESITSKQYNNVYIAGFVDDISVYFKGADIFLNPISTGGGIKTKLVEALGYNLFVVSLQDGAIGIPRDVAGDKLVVINDDNDINAFANAIISVADKDSQIPGAYFAYFYWGDIVKKAAEFLEEN